MIRDFLKKKKKRTNRYIILMKGFLKKLNWQSNCRDLLEKRLIEFVICIEKFGFHGFFELYSALSIIAGGGASISLAWILVMAADTYMLINLSELLYSDKRFLKGKIF